MAKAELAAPPLLPWHGAEAPEQFGAVVAVVVVVGPALATFADADAHGALEWLAGDAGPPDSVLLHAAAEPVVGGC